MRLSKRILLNLFRFYHKRLVDEHNLKCIIWECTLRCNMSCKHCGSDCSYSNQHQDMPFEDFVAVINQTRTYISPRKLKITFSGGEPLMRPDIVKCGMSLKEMGYDWGLVTNGLLLTKQKIFDLINAGLKTISISLDGLEEYHNEFRGNPSSYNKVITAVEELRKYPQVFTSIVTCVTPENISQLPLLKELLIDKLRVNSWRLYPIFPIGRAAKEEKLLLKREELHFLLEFIKNNRKNGQNIKFSCEGFLGDYEGEVRPRFYYCMAGVSIASIRVNGDISGCNSIRYNYAEGNIYKDDFWEIWEGKFKKYRNRSWAKCGECATCKVFKYCLGGGMHLRNSNNELVNCLYKKLI